MPSITLYKCGEVTLSGLSVLVRCYLGYGTTRSVQQVWQLTQPGECLKGFTEYMVSFGGRRLENHQMASAQREHRQLSRILLRQEPEFE
jgi:hypothetical protein